MVQFHGCNAVVSGNKRNVHPLMTSQKRIQMVPSRTRPELRFRSSTGSGGIWACTGRFGQTGTAIFFMVAKKTVEIMYILKSEM